MSKYLLLWKLLYCLSWDSFMPIIIIVGFTPQNQTHYSGSLPPHCHPSLCQFPADSLLCARMCREVESGDIPVLSVGAGKNIELLYTSRGLLGPIHIRQHWEHGCTLINTRSVHCGLPSSGKFVWVRWWACDCYSAESTECTIWLFCGFLAAVRGQAILDSKHRLQI